MKRNRESSQSGLITVEAMLSLVPFIIVILGIISIINIYQVHNKIQYALHQAGAELTGYTYFYQALGVRAADRSLGADIDANTENIDTAIEQFNDFLSEIGTFEDNVSGVRGGDLSGLGDLYGNGQGVYNKGRELYSTAQGFISDPKMLLRELVYLGVEFTEAKAKEFLAGVAAKALLNVYLDESFASFGGMGADEYLKRYGVKDGLDGLSFENSSLFSAESGYRNIDLVVEYEVEVYILKLFFKNPTITIVQRCVLPAWLDGDGLTYNKS